MGTPTSDFDGASESEPTLWTRNTQNAGMAAVYTKIDAVKKTKSTVLLSGETGVGKGVIARMIHTGSDRANQPFIAVHCGAIPDNLIESDLFGHEQGAFTGAVKRKIGKFEQAHGGTLFLDEVGTVSPSLQIKLLQVLQELRFQRVGGEREIAVDVRIIAAANEDLHKLVAEKHFRQDLFYRLNVFPIHIPALRERPEDIAPFANLFLEKFNTRHKKQIHHIDSAALTALQDYAWPGNLRELENALERAIILETDTCLRRHNLPAEIRGDKDPALIVDEPNWDLPLASFRQAVVSQLERDYLDRCLRRHGGKIAATAKAAGMGERQLHKLMTKYGLNKATYRKGSFS